jgi:hypothetical protein
MPTVTINDATVTSIKRSVPFCGILKAVLGDTFPNPPDVMLLGVLQPWQLLSVVYNSVEGQMDYLEPIAR